MKWLFQNRWLTGIIATLVVGILSLRIFGAVDLMVLLSTFLLCVIALSYPSFLERRWQSKHLPADAIHVPADRIRKDKEYALQELFELPQVYSWIKNRYLLKRGDAGAPGMYLYIYLPSAIYDQRNIGIDTVYRRLADKIKAETGDTTDVDFIAQRSLPLAFAFRFLPKNLHKYHEFGKVINIVRKDYFRENTWIRGILQSRKRQFRLHAPEDADWHTFAPYQDDSKVLSGGDLLSHDFRSTALQNIGLARTVDIDAEKVEYPEKIPFGALLTYAKKGEITLEGNADASDKLYIDRVNVLVSGSEHRKEILQLLSGKLKRAVVEEDLYPLFNYGQKLRGYVQASKSLSDSVSSRGNFAIYYDGDKGWTVVKLEPGLELRLQEAFWSSEPKPVINSATLATSRATLLSGGPDSLLRFQITTGTPTRGQVFTADHMIEAKMKFFADLYGYRLVKPVGTGAEGCLYLSEKNGNRFYLKSPDGQLLMEEIETIEALKKIGAIPAQIKTYPEDRMIVMPHYAAIPEAPDGTALPLIFRYLRQVWDAGYLCLDLTPDHVRIEPEQQKLFLIDFSGYVSLARFRKNPADTLADRKKIEYRTPEESQKDFRNAEKLQVYLMGLLMYQLSHPRRGLPIALTSLGNGSQDYEERLKKDLVEFPDFLKHMLAYDPAQRCSFSEMDSVFPPPKETNETFWSRVHS